MSQSSIVTNNLFDVARFDLFDLTGICVEPEPLCPPTEKVAVAPAPAPAMPKPASRIPLVSAAKPSLRNPNFGVEDVRRIRSHTLHKRAGLRPSEEVFNEAFAFASMVVMTIVLRDYGTLPNDRLEPIFTEIKQGLVDIFGDMNGERRYRELKRRVKAELEKVNEKKTFEPAVIVEPAPGLEPMVPVHMLCRELMAAAPADIEDVATRIVGTLKGDDRYAKDEAARKQLLVDTKARVIAVLVASGVSPEEALRRGERVASAFPIHPKKAAPKTTATSGPARPLTADELKAMIGGVGETAEEQDDAAKPERPRESRKTDKPKPTISEAERDARAARQAERDARAKRMATDLTAGAMPPRAPKPPKAKKGDDKKKGRGKRGA